MESDPHSNVDEIVDLRARLSEAQDTLRAIRDGEVDAVVVTGSRGPRVYTLKGADHAYRVLIESMTEGALTLTEDNIILYSNESFASIARSSLDQVIGTSFRQFLSLEDYTDLQKEMKAISGAGAKMDARLVASDGCTVPVLISLRRLPPSIHQDPNDATVGVVVSDMSDAKRKEAQLRDLSRRVIDAQETERGRVALELHDHITQLLCVVRLRAELLAKGLSRRAEGMRAESRNLIEMLGTAIDEVARISHNLRPNVLNDLGLVSVMRSDIMEFTKVTGISAKVDFAPLSERLPYDIEMTFYRTFEEALSNIRQHASARCVTVRLAQEEHRIIVSVQDDGVGFEPEFHMNRDPGSGGFGLLNMRERLGWVGGMLIIDSSPGNGTTILATAPVRNTRHNT